MSSVVNIIRSPVVSATLKTVRLVRRLRDSSFTEAIDAVFAGAPKEVKDVVKKIAELAATITKNPKEPEEIAREVATILGVPQDQVNEFVETAMTIADLVATELREKLITSESTEIETEHYR